MTRRRGRVGFAFPRELLLVEVTRRCRECGEAARLGLTKAEARIYQGFECEHCEEWNEDGLSEADIPDWREELQRLTGLDSLGPAPQTDLTMGGETKVVGRLSDGWRGLRDADKGAGRAGPDEGDA